MLEEEVNFFELQYWKYIPVRHDLDVMHIEKNCCEAILGTLLNIPGKTKDGVAARMDMVDMGIRTDLKPIAGEKRDKLPLAACNLFVAKRKTVCHSFYNMKPPSRFSSNIRNLVSLNDHRIGNLKSHHCHVIMQLFLPIALHSVLDKPVRIVIIRFCLFFKAVCSKVVDSTVLKKVQSDLVDTLCKLEKYFPPSFFDIMIHLTLHLVREVELCGPVMFRWMYLFERYMKVFKGMVNNRKYPEGCIAECYLVEEAVEFVQERMRNGEAATVGLPRRDLTELLNGCKALSAPTVVMVERTELQLAHLTILQNCEDAQPFFRENMEYLGLLYPTMKNNAKWMKDTHNKIFSDWLKDRVSTHGSREEVSDTIRWLAAGPNNLVHMFQGYHVNGADFNTKNRDVNRCVQNSCIFLVVDAMQFASAKDQNPTTTDMNFYGRIKQIWEVDYYNFRVPLFLCDWVESSRGVKVDELEFTLVKLDKLGHFNDPFVLATHAKQIFYVEDPLDTSWYVVVMCPGKDFKGADEDETDQVDDDYYDTGIHAIIEEQTNVIPVLPSDQNLDDDDDDAPFSNARPGEEEYGSTSDMDGTRVTS